MKIITILFFLYFNLQASSLDSTYKNLTQEINKSSILFSPEKKIQLLYLTLATHDKILSNSSTTSLKKKTISILSNIDNTQTIQSLYLSMLKVENKKINTEKTSSLPSYLIFSILSLIVGITLGYILKKKENTSPKEELQRLRSLVEELKNKNTHLNYKLESTNTLKESFFLESKNELENLEKINITLKDENEKLRSSNNINTKA